MNERRTDLTGENYQIYNQLPKYLLRTDVNDRRKGDRAVRGSALMRERYSRMILYIKVIRVVVECGNVDIFIHV